MSADQVPRMWLACHYKIKCHQRLPADPLVFYKKHKLCLVVSQTVSTKAGVITIALDGSKNVKNFSHKKLDYKHVEQKTGRYLHILGLVHQDGSIEMADFTKNPCIANLSLYEFKELLNAFDAAKPLITDPTWLGTTITMIGDMKKRCKFPGKPGIYPQKCHFDD